MNLARLARLAILLCFACLTLSACQGRLTDSPQSRPEVPAGSLPKPALPEIQATCGGRSAAGIRGGYTWAVNGDVKQLDEVWPPPRPSGRLLVAPGEKVTFAITLPAGSPDVTARKAGLSAQLSAWDAYTADNREEAAPVYSDVCEIVEAGPAKVRLSWTVPNALATQGRGNSSVVRLLLRWGDADSSPWVSFYWNLMSLMLSTIVRSMPVIRSRGLGDSTPTPDFAWTQVYVRPSNSKSLNRVLLDTWISENTWFAMP